MLVSPRQLFAGVGYCDRRVLCVCLSVPLWSRYLKNYSSDRNQTCWVYRFGGPLEMIRFWGMQRPGKGGKSTPFDIFPPKDLKPPLKRLLTRRIRPYGSRLTCLTRPDTLCLCTVSRSALVTDKRNTQQRSLLA